MLRLHPGASFSTLFKISSRLIPNSLYLHNVFTPHTFATRLTLKAMPRFFFHPRLHPPRCTLLTHNVFLSLWYAVFSCVCEYLPAGSVLHLQGPLHQHDTCSSFKNLRRKPELTPPSSIHFTVQYVCTPFLQYSSLELRKQVMPPNYSKYRNKWVPRVILRTKIMRTYHIWVTFNSN